MQELADAIWRIGRGELSSDDVEPEIRVELIKLDMILPSHRPLQLTALGETSLARLEVGEPIPELANWEWRND